MRSLQHTINSHFDDMWREINRYTVGFEPTIRMLDKVRSSASDGYPPYDLESLDNDKYRLSMAVAGFKAEEIDITLQNGILEIAGKTATSANEKDKLYLHKGIAGRNFRRTFCLNAWIKITNANLADGILTLDFEQELPESMKPRKIEISTAAKAIESKSST